MRAMVVIALGIVSALIVPMRATAGLAVGLLDGAWSWRRCSRLVVAGIAFVVLALASGLCCGSMRGVVLGGCDVDAGGFWLGGRLCVLEMLVILHAVHGPISTVDGGRDCQCGRPVLGFAKSDIREKSLDAIVRDCVLPEESSLCVCLRMEFEDEGINLVGGAALGLAASGCLNLGKVIADRDVMVLRGRVSLFVFAELLLCLPQATSVLNLWIP